MIKMKLSDNCEYSILTDKRVPGYYLSGEVLGGGKSVSDRGVLFHIRRSRLAHFENIHRLLSCYQSNAGYSRVSGYEIQS